jgi:hypothetical protein
VRSCFYFVDLRACGIERRWSRTFSMIANDCLLNEGLVIGTVRVLGAIAS